MFQGNFRIQNPLLGLVYPYLRVVLPLLGPFKVCCSRPLLLRSKCIRHRQLGTVYNNEIEYFTGKPANGRYKFNTQSKIHQSKKCRQMFAQFDEYDASRMSRWIERGEMEELI